MEADDQQQASEEDFIGLFPLAYRVVREIAIKSYGIELESMTWGGITQRQIPVSRPLESETYLGPDLKLHVRQHHLLDIHYDNGEDELIVSFMTDTSGHVSTPDEITLNLFEHSLSSL